MLSTTELSVRKSMIRIWPRIISAQLGWGTLGLSCQEETEVDLPKDVETTTVVSKHMINAGKELRYLVKIESISIMFKTSSAPSRISRVLSRA